MKIVIIEDEPLAVERLQFLLNQYPVSAEIIARLESVEESVNWFSKFPSPDLVFSDIQLSDGSAFEIFKQVKVNSPIIFTTAYGEYALDAFKWLSIDYLTKPFTLEGFTRAMDKLKVLRTDSASQVIDYDRILKLLQIKSPSYKSRFTGKLGNKLFIIETAQIALFYSENKVVHIMTMDNGMYVSEYTLEQLESLLDPSNFFRINRSVTININCIKQVRPYENNRLQIVLKNNMNHNNLIVSRERVLHFRTWADN